MTGREKVMVALVLVAAYYGVSQLKGGKSSAKAATPKVDEVAHVSSSFKTLKDSIDLSEKEHAVNLLDSPALKEANPFLTARVIEEQGEKDLTRRRSQIDADKFTYDGYFNYAQKKMAIINGNEYEEGEEVKDFPLMVKQIESDWVKLVSDEGWSVKVFYSNKQ